MDVLQRLTAFWQHPPTSAESAEAAFRRLHTDTVRVNGTPFDAAGLLGCGYALHRRHRGLRVRVERAARAAGRLVVTFRVRGWPVDFRSAGGRCGACTGASPGTEDLAGRTWPAWPAYRPGSGCDGLRSWGCTCATVPYGPVTGVDVRVTAVLTFTAGRVSGVWLSPGDLARLDLLLSAPVTTACAA